MSHFYLFQVHRRKKQTESTQFLGPFERHRLYKESKGQLPQFDEPTAAPAKAGIHPATTTMEDNRVARVREHFLSLAGDSTAASPPQPDEDRVARLFAHVKNSVTPSSPAGAVTSTDTLPKTAVMKTITFENGRQIVQDANSEMQGNISDSSGSDGDTSSDSSDSSDDSDSEDAADKSNTSAKGESQTSIIVSDSVSSSDSELEIERSGTPSEVLVNSYNTTTKENNIRKNGSQQTNDKFSPKTKKRKLNEPQTTNSQKKNILISGPSNKSVKKNNRNEEVVAFDYSKANYKMFSSKAGSKGNRGRGRVSFLNVL